MAVAKAYQKRPGADEYRGFTQGVVYAVAWLVRHSDQPALAHDLLRASGITLEDIRTCGLEEHERAPCRKLLGASR